VSDLGSLRPPAASQSAAYLTQAAEALTAAGDPLALWIDTPDYYTSSVLEPFQRIGTAMNRRLSLLRGSVLFSAFAAEAFANEFLSSVLSPADAEAADRLATPDKLLLGPRLAGLESSLDRGREPLQRIIQLNQVRNALVHPRPGGYAAYMQDLSESEEEQIGPKAVGKYLVAVAKVIVLLNPLRTPPGIIGEATLLAEFSNVVVKHVQDTGERIDQVPSQNASRPVDLIEEARRRRLTKARKEPQANL